MCSGTESPAPCHRWLSCTQGCPKHLGALPLRSHRPSPNIHFPALFPGSFSLPMLFGTGSSAHSCLMWHRQPEHGWGTTGACLCARGWQRRDDSRTGTACFYPKRWRSSSTHSISHHPNRPTCPDQSVACVQQLNFAEMVKLVSINPDPNQVFFMTEATA